METSLSDVVNGVILNSSNQGSIMPTWVANAAYKELDPAQISPSRVRLAALEALKQIARQLLRGKFDPTNAVDVQQHELWPDLQTRYPTAKDTSDGEPVYVKLELLSDQDVEWNIGRLRAEAKTKMRHADALEQWHIERARRAA